MLGEDIEICWRIFDKWVHSKSMFYRFGEFELNGDCRELRRAGMTIPCEPQVFDLLGLLIEQRDRVVSKTEIVDTVWNGRIVSDAAVSSRVMAARKALGDDGRRQTLIKTVHGTGFRFVGTVNDTAEPQARESKPAPQQTGPGRRPKRPLTSLVILPFRSLDSGEASLVLTDAVHEDLTTQLARMPDYQILSRGAALLRQDGSDAPEIVGRELGTGYVITGSVRPFASMIRINARVIESSTGLVIAALTFDRKRSELLDLQNMLILEIANALGAEIDFAEVRRLETDADRNPTAFFHFKHSQQILDRDGWNRTSVAKVIDLLETARKVDPDFAPAIGMLALVKGIVSPWGLIDKTPEQIRPEVIALAHEAISKDPHRSSVLGWSGCAFCDAGQPELGQPYLERAIQIDPSNAQARSALGWALILQDQPDAGIERFEQAIQISPNYPGHAIWLYGISLGYKAKGDVANERRILEEAIKLDRNFPPTYISLARLAKDAGDLEAAEAFKSRATALLTGTQANI